MQFDLVVTPVDAPFERYVELAAAAERSGFAALWALDHLSAATFEAEQIAECWTLLAALAARTERLHLGPLVTNATLRAPALIANMAAGLQHISGGRFELGLGAGAGLQGPFSAELRAVGMALADVAERHGRVEAVLEACARQWAPQERRAAELAGFPRPTPRPPVLIGVNSAALARLAGRWADGINTWSTNARRTELFAAADHAALALRRPPPYRSVWAPFDEAWFDPASPARRAAAADAVTRVMLAVRPTAAAVERVTHAEP